MSACGMIFPGSPPFSAVHVREGILTALQFRVPLFSQADDFREIGHIDHGLTSLVNALIHGADHRSRHLLKVGADGLLQQAFTVISGKKTDERQRRQGQDQQQEQQPATDGPGLEGWSAASCRSRHPARIVSHAAYSPASRGRHAPVP